MKIVYPIDSVPALADCSSQAQTYSSNAASNLNSIVTFNASMTCNLVTVLPPQTPLTWTLTMPSQSAVQIVTSNHETSVLFDVFIYSSADEGWYSVVAETAAVHSAAICGTIPVPCVVGGEASVWLKVTHSWGKSRV